MAGDRDSPKPDVACTPEDHANAVMTTLDSLGIEKTVFAGHSMGCIVAIEIASRWLSCVEGLALFGAPVYKAKPRRSLLQRVFRAERGYFSLCKVVKKHPEAVQAGGKVAEELVPFIKGMEITEEVWPAYKKSLENTLMQLATYKKVAILRVAALFVNGIFGFFIILDYGGTYSFEYDINAYPSIVAKAFGRAPSESEQVRIAPFSHKFYRINKNTSRNLRGIFTS